MGVVLRQSIKGTIVTYTGAFIGFVNTLFIFTHFLTPEEIGLQRIIIEAGMMLATLSQLGVPNLGVRFFPHFKSADGKNNGFLLYLIFLPLLGMLFFFTLFILLKAPVSTYFAENSELFVNYYYYILPLAVAIVYQAIFSTYANVLMRIVVPRFITEIGVRVFLLVGVLLYSFDMINLNGFVLSIVLTYLLAAIINFIYLFTIGKVSFKRTKGFVTAKMRKEMILYSLYLLAAVLMSILSLKIDVFMVSAKIGLASTAIYSIAYYMAVIIEMPSRSTISIISPIISNSIKENNWKDVKDNYRKVSSLQYFMGIMIFILLWINVDNIFHFIPNGEFYEEGKYVILFIGLGKLVEMLFSMSGTILSYSSKYRYTLLFTFFYGVMIISTNNWLIPIYGVTGAALATFGSIFVFRLVYIFFVWGTLKVHPFSWSHLSMTGLLMLCIGINFLLPTLENVYLDAAMRSVIVLGTFCLIAYFGKICLDANNIFDAMVKKLMKRKD
ncbi:MAG: oligosaccharide flippase family protein [Bacteroidales bacterium]|jgi:O-antigen/teichoic acid export membrane protein|nr:oligosaccharide flippase family protein [Bacteroidales bacterium]